jgi:HdeA/HdeB family
LLRFARNDGFEMKEREDMLTSITAYAKLFAALRRADWRVALVASATVVASASASQAQVALKTYADEKGYLNVRALTCAQLANTYQEDADFLGTWYSGWFNGHMKRHSINIQRTKDGIHEVIVYCKANPDTKVVDAVETYVKKVQAGGQ